MLRLIKSDDKDFEARATLVHAKLVQINVEIAWYTYLRDNDEISMREKWNELVEMTSRKREIANVGLLNVILGVAVLPSFEIFPPFPFSEAVMAEMYVFSKILTEVEEYESLHKKEPRFATLILTLKTREKFVAFYKGEFERSGHNKEGTDYKKYRNLAHQFIEQLADRLYAK